MYDKLLLFDIGVFEKLNGDLGGFVDFLMIALTSKITLIVSIVATLVYLYLKGFRKELFFTVIGILLVILVADQTCNIFKDQLPRIRPMYEVLLEGKIHLIDGMRGGMSGTVSAHAANSFGVLFLLSLIIKKQNYTIFAMIIAALISYSRIYLGYHYPLDILYGTILGLSTGFVVFRIYNYIIKKQIKNKLKTN